MWILADSKNGYIVDFDVYTGKEGDTAERNLGMKMVMKLTSTLLCGHHGYFDNYFSSIPLLQQLLDRNIYACATSYKTTGRA